MSPQPGGELRRAQELLDLGQLDAALELLRHTVEARPDNSDAQFLLALALHRSGRHREARPPATRAAELDGRYQDATYLAGLLAFLDHDDPTATHWFQHTLDLEPASSLGRSAQGYLDRLRQQQEARSALTQGLQAFQEERCGEAIPLLHRAEQEQPDDPLIRYYQAYCWYRLADWPRARLGFEQTLRLAPGDEWSKLLLARSLLHLGQLAEARRWLQELVGRQPASEASSRAARLLVELDAAEAAETGRVRWSLRGSGHLDSNRAVLPQLPEAGANEDWSEAVGLETAFELDLIQHQDHELELDAASAILLYPVEERSFDRVRGQVELQYRWIPSTQFLFWSRVQAALFTTGYEQLEHQEVGSLGLALRLLRPAATSLQFSLLRRTTGTEGLGTIRVQGLGLELNQTLGPLRSRHLSLLLRLGYGLATEVGATATATGEFLVPGTADAPSFSGTTLFQWNPTLQAHGPAGSLRLTLPAGFELFGWSRLTWASYQKAQSVSWEWEDGQQTWSKQNTETRLEIRGTLSWAIHPPWICTLEVDWHLNRSSIGEEVTDPFDQNTERLVGWVGFGYCGGGPCSSFTLNPL